MMGAPFLIIKQDVMRSIFIKDFQEEMHSGEINHFTPLPSFSPPWIIFIISDWLVWWK